MRVSKPGKSGFTLVEVLVVVTIMGVLSTMGVVSLRSAVINTRIKDAGINVTAYMQRAANEAIRMNTKLCVVAVGKKILTYKAECGTDPAAANLGSAIDQMELEAANAFVSTYNNCPDGGTRFANNMVTITPKVGVSPIPAGCFIVQYGTTDRMAASVRQSTKYAMYYKLSYDSGSSWF